MRGLVSLDPGKLPQPTGCSFSWSVSAMLQARGKDVPGFEIGGFSLNAFSVWAHPREPVKFWSEVFCDMFAEELFRSMGMHAENLSAPSREHDLLGYFLHHWSGRVAVSLASDLPVAASGVWPETMWGIITEWDQEKRILKGFLPGSKEKLENSCWPRKIIILGATTVKPEVETSVKRVLNQIVNLAEGRLKQGNWALGLDAYVLWVRLLSQGYSKELSEHTQFAQHLSQARKEAVRFLTHHADFQDSKTERLMLSLARRYNRVSENLKEAASAPGERPFINSVTEALAEEEKTLALLEELLFNIE